MMSTILLADADLHGLVDDRLDSERRVDVLRRLAFSPADRVKVEAWQEQNELLRAAFAGVLREALPPIFDLAPSPHHQHSFRQSIADADPLALDTPRPKPGRRAAAALAAALVAAVGLGGSWMLLDAGVGDTSKDVGGVEADGPVPALRGTLDTILAARAAQALSDGPRQARSLGTDQRLPTTTIPDLSQAGFTLTSAEHETTAPASLVFHYRNADAEQVAISVAHADGDVSTQPARLGRTYHWHRHDKAYAIAGTVVPQRLREIAVSLLDDGAAN